MKKSATAPIFARCVYVDGYPESLEEGKLYRVVPDTTAKQHKQIRVIDESGEDYLFSAESFELFKPGPIRPLLELEEENSRVLLSVATTLEESYARMVLAAHNSLEGCELTKAILLRLRTFNMLQERITSLLDKGVKAPAAEVFTETVTFFLKVHAEISWPEVCVKSEVKIGSKRPDISLWYEDKPIVTIECKTQLGYQRSTWESQYLERDKAFKECGCQHNFLLVLTEENWGGFGNHLLCGKRFFCLSTVWPHFLPNKLDEWENYISDARFEDLLNTIEECLPSNALAVGGFKRLRRRILGSGGPRLICKGKKSVLKQNEKLLA